MSSKRLPAPTRSTISTVKSPLQNKPVVPVPPTTHIATAKAVKPADTSPRKIPPPPANPPLLSKSSSTAGKVSTSNSGQIQPPAANTIATPLDHGAAKLDTKPPLPPPRPSAGKVAPRLQTNGVNDKIGNTVPTPGPGLAPLQSATPPPKAGLGSLLKQGLNNPLLGSVGGSIKGLATASAQSSLATDKLGIVGSVLNGVIQPATMTADPGNVLSGTGSIAPDAGSNFKNPTLATQNSTGVAVNPSPETQDTSTAPDIIPPVIQIPSNSEVVPSAVEPDTNELHLNASQLPLNTTAPENGLAHVIVHEPKVDRASYEHLDPDAAIEPQPTKVPEANDWIVFLAEPHQLVKVGWWKTFGVWEEAEYYRVPCYWSADEAFKQYTPGKHILGWV